MRIALSVSALFVLATPVFAAEDVPDEETAETAPEGEAPSAPRACTPAQVIVPPFNNTPEAMEQSRVAATVLRGDEICKASAVFPEKSLIEHGEEMPVLPDDAAAEPTQEQAPVEPA